VDKPEEDPAPGAPKIKQLLETSALSSAPPKSYYKNSSPGRRRSERKKHMSLFYIFGIPLGYVMEWIYKLIPNYGWDIILFTLVIRLISIPLTISQQKNMAKMSAFQPMVADIQKKYAKNQEKQQEEMTKLQQDFGYNPMSGCLPMFLNFFVMFGVLDVVYRPLQRILHVTTASMTAAATALGTKVADFTLSTKVISAVLEGNTSVTSAFSATELANISEFATHMNFFGIDLTQVPKLSVAPAAIPLLIFPILSLITMFLSTHFSMKASGQQMQGGMKIMMYAMPLMFVYFGFTVPVAFSLYYTISNIVMTVQSEVMRRMYDPEKVKAQVMAEIELKKKQQRRGVKSTTVREVDASTGEMVEHNVSASEMNKRRLEYARKLDEEKYAGERTLPLSALEAQKNAEELKGVLNGKDSHSEEE
jgi:YidC/Oxa1 family membrane protein insertase